MFLTLMRKDLRLLRGPIVAIVCVCAFVELVLGPLSAYSQIGRFHRSGGIDRGIEARIIWSAISNHAQMAMYASYVFVACCAGTGLPIERRERWADFAAMLPVPRGRQIFARLVVAATLAALVYGAHVVLLAVTTAWAYPQYATAFPARAQIQAILDWVPFAIGTFGVAWLGAAWMRNATINVTFAAALIPAGFMLSGEIASAMGEPSWAFESAYSKLLLAGGLLATVAGSVVAARRVSP